MPGALDMTRLKKMKSWLLQENEEPRRAPRSRQPEIVVHYWAGNERGGRTLRDISETGAYIYTQEQWYPGTIIRIVMEGQRGRAGGDQTPPAEVTTCVNCRVVRQDAGGVAVEFLVSGKAEREELRKFLTAVKADGRMEKAQSGQALVEFSLIFPLVFLLAVNAVNFGGYLFAWITVANAARAGVQYMAMSSASPGSPTPATATQVSALIASDTASLLNKASIVVATCTNATTSANACTSLTDPEAPSYTLATVDVTYTYQPFIPLFSFPGTGISATLPSTSIHRKAVMRMLQ
jgi:Flp pilus assembly protein TadG